MQSNEYWEGYEAYQTGVNRLDGNPYNPWTQEYQWEAWNSGYTDASWDD